VQHRGKPFKVNSWDMKSEKSATACRQAQNEGIKDKLLENAEQRGRSGFIGISTARETAAA